jgi:hypothetical protein
MHSTGPRWPPAAETMDNLGVRAQYHPDYYAAFVYDPDGNNIEVVCRKG